METSERAGHGEYKIPGGKLVVVDLAVTAGHISAVQVSGDFFLEPDTALDAVNGALLGLARGIDAEALAASVSDALAPGTQLYGISPEGVAIAVRRALDAAAAADGGDAAA